MRIVDRKTLMDQPGGTIYAEYWPCHFGDLYIKGDTTNGGGVGGWFYDASLHGYVCETEDGDQADTLFKMERTGLSVPVDYEMGGRDGNYEQGQLYAIYEQADHSALIARLQLAAKDAFGATQ